jgi:hypothetical protein
MPTVYLRQELYKILIKRDIEPANFVNKLVEKKLIEEGVLKKEEPSKEKWNVYKPE